MRIDIVVKGEAFGSESGLKSQLCHYLTLREQLNLSKPIFPHSENWDSNSTFLKGLLYGLNGGKKTNMYISLSNARSDKCQANVHV